MEGKMRETISDYLKRHGFIKTVWDVWLPDEDWNPAFNPAVWPEVGSNVLAPTFALDELGEPLRDRYSIVQLVLLKVRGFHYWVVRDRFPHRLKSKSFEAAAWDAAFLATVRSVPVTLREDRLVEASYRHNRKYYVP
jgi:hypothetical protein